MPLRTAASTPSASSRQQASASPARLLSRPDSRLSTPLPGVDLDGLPRLLAEPLVVHLRHDGPEVRHGVLELRLERVDEAEGPHRPLARAAALVAVAPHGREAHPSRLGRRLLQVRGTPRSTCVYARYHT